MNLRACNFVHHTNDALYIGAYLWYFLLCIRARFCAVHQSHTEKENLPGFVLLTHSLVSRSCSSAIWTIFRRVCVCVSVCSLDIRISRRVTTGWVAGTEQGVSGAAVQRSSWGPPQPPERGRCWHCPVPVLVLELYCGCTVLVGHLPWPCVAWHGGSLRTRGLPCSPPGPGRSQAARPWASLASAWPLLAQLLAASWSGPLSHPLAHIFIRNVSSLERLPLTEIAEGGVSDISFSWLPSPVTYCCPLEKRSCRGQMVWAASELVCAVSGGLWMWMWKMEPPHPPGGNDWAAALGCWSSVARSAWAPHGSLRIRWGGAGQVQALASAVALVYDKTLFLQSGLTVVSRLSVRRDLPNGFFKSMVLPKGC